MKLIRKVNLLLIIGALVILGMGFIVSNKTSKDKGDVIIGTAVGNKAPEIKQLNPEGKPLTLSSYKGKIVLIDFWASWCGPCRRENPNIVATYNKFKDSKFKNAKGFVIYSVSLDQNKEAWMRAIQSDQLSWDAHVSDLRGWGSEAGALYGVNSIPMNFLLDAKGIIIAKNLKGPSLEAELAKLVK